MNIRVKNLYINMLMRKKQKLLDRMPFNRELTIKDFSSRKMTIITKKVYNLNFKDIDLFEKHNG